MHVRRDADSVRMFLRHPVQLLAQDLKMRGVEAIARIGIGGNGLGRATVLNGRKSSPDYDPNIDDGRRRAAGRL